MTTGSCVSMPTDSADSGRPGNYPTAGFRVTAPPIARSGAEALTVFLELVGLDRMAAIRRKFDQSLPIVSGTGQISNRRNFPLNSRAKISDVSGGRFFVVRRINL